MTEKIVTKSFKNRTYWILYCTRILLFFSIVFYINDIAIMITLLYISNLAFTIMDKMIKIRDKMDAKLEKFNQFCTLINIIMIILFTDFVNDEIVKFKYGLFLIEFIFINFIIGFLIPFMIENLKLVKAIQLWWYKRKIQKKIKINISR